MPGITTAMVVFILVGVALPALIKSKGQFYAAVAFTAATILFSPFAFGISASATFFSFVVAILQVLAFVALVLCTGGLELHEFASHMADAYDTLRHGEERNKPIIVPRTVAAKTEPVVNSADFSPPPPPPISPIEASIPVEPLPPEEHLPDAGSNTDLV